MQTDVAIAAADGNSFHDFFACTIAGTHASTYGDASHEHQLIATLDPTGPHGYNVLHGSPGGTKFDRHHSPTASPRTGCFLSNSAGR